MNSLPSSPLQPKESVTVLVVSPSADDITSLLNILRHSNWILKRAAGCMEALAELHNHPIPVVLCKSNLPDGDWQALLEECANLPSPPRFIVYSRLADERLWAGVLNLGGWDVLAMPFDPEEVFRVTYLAWDSWKHAVGRPGPFDKQSASAAFCRQ